MKPGSLKRSHRKKDGQYHEMCCDCEHAYSANMGNTFFETNDSGVGQRVRYRRSDRDKDRGKEREEQQRDRIHGRRVVTLDIQVTRMSS